MHYVPGQYDIRLRKAGGMAGGSLRRCLPDWRKQEHGHENYEATDNCHAGAPLEMLSLCPEH
jgi:hypothetical protein